MCRREEHILKKKIPLRCKYRIPFVPLTVDYHITGYWSWKGPCLVSYLRSISLRCATLELSWATMSILGKQNARKFYLLLHLLGLSTINLLAGHSCLRGSPVLPEMTQLEAETPCLP